MTIKTPPQRNNDAPLVHKVSYFYKKVYLLKPRLSKLNRYGIYLKIEQICLEVVSDIIMASFESKRDKVTALKRARVHVELLKKLFTFAEDLDIIPLKTYTEFESDLQEISKMTNGWIKYIEAAHE